ncbi:MAG TPA: xanthine dehydrogenase accessory protein XdhC [Casimicrobiaceae bacterium]|nr:xanthine dehydrogenase accessory protein XdhC [Casimicrobiaceae bacterium]
MADFPGGLIAELSARVARDGRAVLVTIAHASGSTPREAGTSMIVGARDVFATIGGGHLEFEAIRIGRDALVQREAPRPWLVRFPLAARLGQCCGGVATLVFAVVDGRDSAWIREAEQCERERCAMTIVTRVGGDGDAHTVERRPEATTGGAALVPSASGDGTTSLVHTIVPTDFNVVVFGNGHVGRALIQVLGVLPVHVRWVDERESDFPPSAPANVEVVATDAPEAELDGAPRGAFVVVATHNHALDLAVVTAALARDDWRYLGLIGSVSKRNQFEKRLAARGFASEQLARITCPIGRAGLAIRGKAPGAIAVAVAAEMLTLYETPKKGSDPITRPVPIC